MKRVKHLLVGLMLVLLGAVVALWTVTYLARQPAVPQRPNSGEIATIQTAPAAPIPPAGMPANLALRGATHPGDPTFAISTSGRIAGRPIVELPELLGSPFVQALLQLSDEQKEELRKLERSDGAVFEPDKRDLEMRGIEFARSQDSVVAHQNRAKDREAVLDQTQVTLARRILCQLNQEYSFADPQVSADLSITPNQLAEMQRILQTTLPPMTGEEKVAFRALAQQASQRRLASRVGNDAIRNASLRIEGLDGAEQVVRERNRKLAENAPAVCQKLLYVLTPEQMRKWDEMQGVRMEPWELEEIRGGLGGAMLVTQP